MSRLVSDREAGHYMRAFLTVLASILCVLASVVCLAQHPDNHRYTRVTDVPRDKVNAWLEEQVKQSGGDWNKDRYSFYIGFSTGGYGTDPVEAIAMDRVAFGIINNSLAVGDRVTPFAWELQDGKMQGSIDLTDDAATRKQFVSEVPDAPLANSKGGHDIERALFDTIEAIRHIDANQQDSSIILLLTNSNQSQLPDHSTNSLFGANNPQLAKEINNGEWRPLVRTQFTCSSAKDGDKVVCITALFPKKLKSLTPSGADRYPTFARESWQPPDDEPAANEPLPNKTQQTKVTPPPTTGGPPAQPPAQGHGIPWWFWLLLGLIVVAVILFVVVGKRAGVQRPLQPVAVAAPAAPKVETIPGSLKMTIGPDEQTLSPLAKTSAWTLTKQADGSIKLLEPNKPAAAATVPGQPPAATESPGTTLANIYLAGDRILHADADSGAQFADLQGTAADKCDSRSLRIEPGKRVLCRIQPADASSKTRFEVVYDTLAAKGTRA